MHSAVAVLLTLVSLGPFWALSVAVPSMLYRDPLRVVYCCATRVLSVSAAAYAFGVFAAPLIPLEAKILAAVSLYASLMLDGPHRPGLAPQDARRELVTQMGKALDRQATMVLLRLSTQATKTTCGGRRSVHLRRRLVGAHSSKNTPLRPTGTAKDE
jgi:hypothetical protein